MSIFFFRCIMLKRVMWHLFCDFSQSEKNYEIKPSLVMYVVLLLCRWHSYIVIYLAHYLLLSIPNFPSSICKCQEMSSITDQVCIVCNIFMATYIPQDHHSINANFIARPNYGQARIPFSNVIKSNGLNETSFTSRLKVLQFIATRSVPNHKLSFLLHTYFLKIKYLSTLRSLLNEQLA